MRKSFLRNEIAFKRWASHLKVDDSKEKNVPCDIKEEIRKYPPLKFPCLAVYSFEYTFGRCGECGLAMWDYIYNTDFKRD